jgi:hypothetical protein
MLNSVDAMLRFSRTSLVVASVSAIGLVSEIARAQTTAPTTTATTSVPGLTGTGPSINMTQQVNPLRFVNGQQVNQRPPGLTPLGVNYQDCINDMTLQFSVTLSGFDGTTNSLQVWATKSGDCTAPSTRGLGGALANTCWLVNQGLPVPNIEVGQTKQFNVRVQDLVGPQNVPPHGANLVREDASACTQQPSFAPVPMTIWFLAIDSAGNSNGTPFQYQIPTDLIGPPPPALGKPALGDTLMTVSWTPNTDGDTGGYDIFIDQPGTQADGAVASNTQVTCPDSGSATVADAAMEAASGAPPDDATADATASVDATTITDAMAAAEASSSDAGCKSSHVGGNSSPTTSDTMCTVDPVLAGGIVQDGGAPAAVVTSDEAGDDASTTLVPTGGGGISTIPASFVVNPNVSTGETVSGQTNSTYMITGLQNQVTYNVVVAAVDNSGNVGPPSVQACGTPAPVDDFWKIYREDGGRAGGFCALEAVGSPAGSTLTLVGLGSLALAAVGRRRRRRAR